VGNGPDDLESTAGKEGTEVVRVLLLHNHYRHAGGEDAVVEQEMKLLASKGHELRLVAVDNTAIVGIVAQAKVALGTVYSHRSRVRVREEIASFAPDLVHVHNFFPQLSPSVYYACREAQVPVVQTLHNFRLICSNGLLFREGQPCESCVGKTLPWPGIVHACYRNSHAGSAVVASMLGAHRLWGTWNRAVDAYVTLSRFARQKLLAGGIPADRLFVKPNFVMPDPGSSRSPKGYALFVGRLSPEKGVETLLSAWRRLRGGRKLKVVGDGPLRRVVQEAQNPHIEYVGRQSSDTVLALMGAASFLVFPSECYENFPRVIVEAFAKGLPVLASRIGAAEEVIDDRRTGLLFRSGDPEALADGAEWLFSHPDALEPMSYAARTEFEGKYTAERNYDQLMAIYRSALQICGTRLRESHPMQAVAP
jgi:glycosyltransferase involved in cell wall biosynthesis